MIEDKKVSIGRFISAMFLVAGTCTGGGMLALPVATGFNGFIPSIAVMLLCWFAMTATALMLLEVSLWLPEGAHMISMSSAILGKPGKAVAWLIYLFICYASLVAYTAAGGLMMSEAVGWLSNWEISKQLGAVIFILLFGFTIDMGTNIVGRVNTILFIGMVAAYFIMVGAGIGSVKNEFLFRREWFGAWLAIPLLLTSFSFQTMVPSLTPYLKRNSQYLRWAIIGGTTITLLIYAIWQGLVIGIVPVGGADSLTEALLKGEPATQYFRQHIGTPWIATVAEYFAFFALVTSFLGIALGLFDFLSDGLKIEKKGWGKIALGLLVAVPTLIFATQFERIFLIALDTSGGFGDAILSGMMPVLMVWVGRYYKNMKADFRVGGGKPFLALIFVLFFAAFILEILILSGVICSSAQLCQDFMPR